MAATTLTVTEAREEAERAKGVSKRLRDKLAEQSERVRRTIVTVAGAGVAATARGYYGDAYKVMGVDASLGAGIGLALLSAMSDDPEMADYATDLADAALAEYVVVQGLSMGMAMRLKKSPVAGTLQDVGASDAMSVDELISRVAQQAR
jgi:hypothetical protein